MELQNNTPYEAVWSACTDENGRDTVYVLCKCSFQIDASGRLEVADKQVPVLMHDSFRGEPGKSSTLWESDAIFAKKGADVLLLGHAHAPHDGATQVDVMIRVADRQKTVRVFGDRYWASSIGGAHITQPTPFDRIPLTFERAFGGIATNAQGDVSQCADNPVGQGYCVDKGQLDGTLLPNLENPNELIRKWNDRPTPAGCAFFGRHWSPRRELAGTYDDAWTQNRCPLLPEDFNLRHFNAAHPDLILDEPLRGNELVIVRNAAKSELEFHVPVVRLIWHVLLNGKIQQEQPVIDTMVIDTDRMLVILLLRAAIKCHREILGLGGLRLDMVNGPL